MFVYTSIPFFPFGGVLGENDSCKEIILKKAQTLIDENRNFKFLQIRQREELSINLSVPFILQKPITNFFLDLKGTEDQMFNSLDKRVRYDIRKAKKHGLTFLLNNSQELLSDFYEVYLNTRKRRSIIATRRNKSDSLN